MTGKRHKGDTRTFRELTWNEQVKSINAQVTTLEKALRVHFGRTRSEHKDVEKRRQAVLAQVQRLVNKIPMLH